MKTAAFIAFITGRNECQSRSEIRGISIAVIEMIFGNGFAPVRFLTPFSPRFLGSLETPHFLLSIIVFRSFFHLGSPFFLCVLKHLDWPTKSAALVSGSRRLNLPMSLPSFSKTFAFIDI